MIDQLIVTNDYLTLILKVLVFTNMSFLFLFGFRAIIIKLIDAFSKSEQKPLPIKKVFPDPALADYILQEMNKRVGVFKASTDDLISEEDLQYITKVNLENKGIKSIKGIDKLVNCKEINLAHNQISVKPRPLDLPSELKMIDLSYNQIREEWTFDPSVMMDLSFNPGNQKHNPVFYSRTMIEDLMKQIGISVSNQDRIWYLYFFNAARLITEEKPCFSELGFYKNGNNCLEIKGKEIKAYPSRFYRDDYERFKSILAGIHQNYQVLKNNKDDPFSSMPENAYINNLTIYQYYASHSYMLGIKTDEVSHKNKDFYRDKDIVTEKNNTIPKVYKPSKNYTTLQEKIFSINALLAENDPSDPMISLLKAIADSTEKIDRFIFDHPESKDSLRRYSAYYLPMLSDILDKYIDSTEYKEESRSFKDEVQSALEDTSIAFKKILENLSHSMEIEASCDITAYRSILEMDGVSGDDFSSNQEDSKS
ncbi:internalin N-terminal domain-containing protein [Eubacterium callanderi]|uniref:Internalin-A n=1 Tax=Eubacterium limosum TaxID=1736 RepID=A0A6N3HC23_EUBLI|nr:hypothetical protein [Eubacterium callanderi]